MSLKKNGISGVYNSLLDRWAFKFVFPKLYPAAQPKFYRLRKESVAAGEQWQQQLGGTSITINSGKEKLDGMYFSAREYQRRKPQVAEIIPDLPIPNMGQPSLVKVAVICSGQGRYCHLIKRQLLNFLERDIDVVIFDYRGHAKSTGKPSYEGMCQDALSAGLWAEKCGGFSVKEILFFGHSMGGSPAAWAAAEIGAAWLVLDRTFASMVLAAEEYWNKRPSLRMLGRLIPFLKSKLLKFVANYFPYPTEDLIAGFQGKILIISANDDQIIPSYHADRLFAACKQPHKADKQKLMSVPGGHCDEEDRFTWLDDLSSQKRFNEFLMKNITE
ncbi:MAG: alpha/beta hydrolase [Chlamydiota bacterium]